MKEKYIVVDLHTDGILCECYSISIAHSVAKGFINSSPKILPASVPWLTEKFNKDFNSFESFYQHRNMQVFDMKPELITNEYIDLKKLANLRNALQHVWEARCRQFLLYRNYEYFASNELEGYLVAELNVCRPDENYFTPAINEWAELNEIAVDVAYQELRMRSTSIGRQHIRNHAIHQKFVNLINQQFTEKEMVSVLNRGIDYLIGRDRI